MSAVSPGRAPSPGRSLSPDGHGVSPAGRVASPGGRTRTVRPALLTLASVAVLVGVWQVVAMARIWPPVFVPEPADVWRQLIRTSTQGYSGYTLAEHLLASLRRILLGCLYGVGGGVVLGLLIGLVPTIRALVGPLVTFVRTLPPLAYLSLLVIWFGIDEQPKIWLLLLAALPPVAVATAEAVRGVHEDYLNAARSLGAGPWELPWRVVLPSALPEIITGVRVAVGVAYTTVVAAETVNGVPGIGGMVRDAQRYNQTDVVILGIVVIGLSGLLIDVLLQALDRRLVPWRGRG
ncbi:ABC transporter permease [Microbispora corallina]|uniref:ABC transporter, permease protein n=1 Tax=Microbispora corallina TaxID=83302 RepID=A0ABQ4FR54_9ACTN|nr:ABC transporter permease [Microbispora corallina]GIH37291.1 putative ABC transporter, permease protein [Microbispora corallina]